MSCWEQILSVYLEQPPHHPWFLANHYRLVLVQIDHDSVVAAVVQMSTLFFVDFQNKLVVATSVVVVEIVSVRIVRKTLTRIGTVPVRYLY